MSGGKAAPFNAGDRVALVVTGNRVKYKYGTVRSCSLMSNDEFQTTVDYDDGDIGAPLHECLELVHTGDARKYVDEFGIPIGSDEPLRVRRSKAMKNIAKLAALRAAVEEAIAENVAIARHRGAQHYDYGQPSWSDIGERLGVTKQAAQARYGKATMQK